MSVLTRVSRRRFLQLTGVAAGSLVLGSVLPGRAALAGVLDQSSGAALNVFVSIREDGTVEIVAHRSEMGTGIRTSLPQIVAGRNGGRLAACAGDSGTGESCLWEPEH